MQNRSTAQQNLARAKLALLSPPASKEVTQANAYTDLVQHARGTVSRHPFACLGAVAAGAAVLARYPAARKLVGKAMHVASRVAVAKLMAAQQQQQ